MCALLCLSLVRRVTLNTRHTQFSEYRRCWFIWLKLWKQQHVVPTFFSVVLIMLGNNMSSRMVMVSKMRFTKKLSPNVNKKKNNLSCVKWSHAAAEAFKKRRKINANTFTRPANLPSLALWVCLCRSRNISTIIKWSLSKFLTDWLNAKIQRKRIIIRLFSQSYSFHHPVQIVGVALFSKRIVLSGRFSMIINRC